MKNKLNCKECTHYKENEECNLYFLDEDDQKCNSFSRYNEKDQDERYAKLPVAFQKRLTRFRTNNPNFKREFEHYELFCCEEAVKIADFCKANDKTAKEFYENRELQKGVVFDGHSGNSLGISFRLAQLYLEDPDLVILEHGALSGLVGCPEYGCDNPPKQSTIDLLTIAGKERFTKLLNEKKVEIK